MTVFPGPEARSPWSHRRPPSGVGGLPVISRELRGPWVLRRPLGSGFEGAKNQGWECLGSTVHCQGKAGSPTKGPGAGGCGGDVPVPGGCGGSTSLADFWVSFPALPALCRLC